MMPSIVQARGGHARFRLHPLFILLAGSLLGTAAAAAERRADATPSAAGAVTTGTTAKIVGSAVVNVTELSRLEAMGLAPRPAIRPLIREEEWEENEMDEEPGAGRMGSISPEAMITRPPFVPFVASPSPTTSFIGLDDIPMVDSSYIVIPPDIAGGVGPTRVMESFNNNYRVRDKVTGATVLTVGTATFWNPVITNKALLNGLTDPRTTYDPINNRWIVAMQTVNTSGLILFGVSQTSDPAGSWFLYAVQLSGSYLIDFPILGFNKNWIVVTINRYTSPGGMFARGVAVVGSYPLARAGTLASVTVFDGAAGTRFCASPCVTLSATEDTMFVVTHLASAGATFQVDLITSTPTYVSGGTLTRPGGGWVQPGGNLLPQSAPVSGASACGATPCPIESQDAQVRSAPVYRVDTTTGRGFIYYTQTVGLPSGGLTHTGVQWTKITPSTTAAFADGGRIEDPTATSTNGGKWYAFTHIAVNSAGDLIVGYTQYSSAQHPSSGYSYRDHTDALGTIRDAFIYHAGEDYYHKTFTTTTGRNRWGDFSTAQVDPSDDQTLWTLQEYAKTRTSTDDGNTGANGSKWSSWWAAVSPPAGGPTVTLDAGPSVNEGNAGTTGFTFTARLSATSGSNVTVNYQTSDGTATIANADYQAASSSIVIPAGNLTGAITVLVNGDTKRESNETFTLSLTGATGATVGSPSTATGTILNDDGVPTLAIADVAVTEGNAGTTGALFTVSLSNQTDQVVTVHYQTADGTATVANNDYQAASGTLTIPAKTSSATITVLVNGDTKREGNETFVVNLTSPTNATIADAQGQGTINNDDAVPTLAIADVKVIEGNAGTVNAVFTVSLSNQTDQVVTVDYSTSDGTATLGNGDYAAASGTLVIPAKTSGGTITVVANGDGKFEGDETFFVSLSNPVNATIADGLGVGTISNDDGPPTVSIGDATVTEGNSGSVAAVFTISLSAPAGVSVMVSYTTADGSATVADGDYVAASGAVKIPAKEGSVTVTVVVNGDIANEGDETFAVNLTAATNAVIGDGNGTGTIVDDDLGPQVTVIAPNGGEELFTGTPYPVSWSASDVGSKTIVAADLYVSNDNGANFAVVALNQPNTGSYEWVPADSVQTNSPASPGPTYLGLFRVVARDADGKVGQDLSDATFAITNRAKLSVPGSGRLEFALTGVKPIPAPGPVRIGFSLARSAAVRLSIVDLQGRTIAVLADGTIDAGRYETVWRHGTEVPAGIYFASYRVPGKVFTRRFVVTR